MAVFLHRASVTIDHTKCGSSNSSNFPLTFNSTVAALKTIANGGEVFNGNGYDIIFAANSDGSGQLDHEIERYNAATGELIAHVRVPTLSSSVDTIIYLCWGNPAISTSQENKTGVWDSNFISIYHFPDGTTLGLNDSTSNANTLTNTNSMAAGAGKIDGDAAPDGSARYLRRATITGTFGTVLTLSAWVKLSVNSGSGQQIIDINRSPSNFTNQAKLFAYNGGIFFQDYDGTTAGFGLGVANIADGNWHHVAFVRNGTSGILYVDGNVDSTQTSALNLTYSGNDFVVGADYRNSSDYWNGGIDECRFSNTNRSADWVKTEYNNQNSPGTFYSIGPELTNPAIPRQILRQAVKRGSLI